MGIYRTRLVKREAATPLQNLSGIGTFSQNASADINEITESGVITVSGAVMPTPVNVVGGQFAKSTDGGATWGAWSLGVASNTVAMTTAVNGDKFKLRVQAAPYGVAYRTCTFMVGNVFRTFAVRTSGYESSGGGKHRFTYFDGTNDWLRMGRTALAATVIPSFSSFTLAFKVKFRGALTTSQRIFNLAPSTTGTSKFNLFRLGTAGNARRLALSFARADNAVSSNGNMYLSSGALADDTEYTIHITGRFDAALGSIGNSYIRCWINGTEQMASQTCTGTVMNAGIQCAITDTALWESWAVGISESTLGVFIGHLHAEFGFLYFNAAADGSAADTTPGHFYSSGDVNLGDAGNAAGAAYPQIYIRGDLGSYAMANHPYFLPGAATRFTHRQYFDGISSGLSKVAPKLVDAAALTFSTWVMFHEQNTVYSSGQTSGRIINLIAHNYQNSLGAGSYAQMFRLSKRTDGHLDVTYVSPTAWAIDPIAATESTAAQYPAGFALNTPYHLYAQVSVANGIKLWVNGALAYDQPTAYSPADGLVPLGVVVEMSFGVGQFNLQNINRLHGTMWDLMFHDAIVSSASALYNSGNSVDFIGDGSNILGVQPKVLFCGDTDEWNAGANRGSLGAFSMRGAVVPG